MSEKLTCPLCGHNETFTLITHLRNEHKVEPEALRSQFPEQALASDTLCRFLNERRVQRRGGVLHYQLDVAGTQMTARYGLDHPLVPQSDPTFVWTDPCKDVAEAIEHNERVFLYGPSGTGKSMLVRQIAAVTQRPVRRVSLNGETSVGDFVGHWTVNENKETVFVKGILPQALQEGHILQLDEVDAMQPEVGFVLQQVLELMENGESFSDSILRFPNVFNQLSYSIILAGESGGNLALSLRRVAEYFDNRDKLAKKVKGAMAYPVFVMAFILLVIIFIMTFIIPRFRVIFTQIGGKLPTFTRGFLAFYDAIAFNLPFIIAGVLLLILLGILFYSKTYMGHLLFSRIALRWPLMGKILKQAFLATFCRTMSTLIEAGVPVLDVFDILSAMARNDVIREAIENTKEYVGQGSSMASGMTAAGFFPKLVTKMTDVGEQSGSLSRVLDRTADYYERKVDSTITTMLALLEPTLVITVGAIVLVVVMALYLPIFEMSNITR